MGFKRLISPEFRISTEKYEITSGMEVECFSSRESRSDWCRVELTSQLQGIISYEDMEKATVELGYEDDYDLLLSGYCKRTEGDYWKEIMIRDAMIKIERVNIKNTFIDCTPQDIIRYVLAQAGINDYQLNSTEYGKKDMFIVNRQNGVDTIAQVGSIWGIHNDFFFQNEVFYWGCKPEQQMVYVLEEDENILSLKRYGELYEIETLGVPWIHHSQEIEVSHSKYSGIVKVDKTIIKRDVRGYTRMYIYFKGEGGDKMSNMLQGFVKKEMEKQIREKYPHMQHPAGVYAKVVHVREYSGDYVYTLKLLDRAMNIDNDFPEIPNVKTDIKLKLEDVAVILLLYGGSQVFVLGRYEP